MAQRVAVVSTDVSGISELVTNMENGLLVPEKDAASLAKAVETLLHDPELRWRMGQKGRDKVMREFSLETSGAAVWGAFKERFEASEGSCAGRAR